MKCTATVASLLALLLTPIAFAQTGAASGSAMSGMPMQHCADMMQGRDRQSCQEMMKDMPAKPASKAKAATHHATGVVKAIDPDKGSVTLAHDPVASLHWPAMTMRFAVKDKALFDKLAVDKKVGFDFKQQGKDYVVTAVR